MKNDSLVTRVAICQRYSLETEQTRTIINTVINTFILIEQTTNPKTVTIFIWLYNIQSLGLLPFFEPYWPISPGDCYRGLRECYIQSPRLIHMVVHSIVPGAAAVVPISGNKNQSRDCLQPYSFGGAQHSLWDCCRSSKHVGQTTFLGTITRVYEFILAIVKE